MTDKKHLDDFRANLVDRLATLVYRGVSATDKDRLAEIAQVKSAIDAVDFVKENDIPKPPEPDVAGMFVV